MTSRHVVVDIFRDQGESDCVVFELRHEEELLLATENPASIAAAIFVMNARSVMFSYSNQSRNYSYSAVTPFDDGDLKGLRAIAQEEIDLTALLSIVYACHILLEYAQGLKRMPKGAVAYHWLAAVRLLPQNLVHNRPAFEPPADWQAWMTRQKKYIRYIKKQGGGQEAIGQD